MATNKLQVCAFVVGTRPEVIKVAPIILAMREQPKAFKPLLWLTGQHTDMVSQALDTFGLAADADFALMQPNQSQSKLIGKILQLLDPLIAQERPDWLLVQGDTTTALAGALAGYYAQVPVIHVEAGLRTYDLSAPFPEEGNRQMISRIARLHCAPTARAVDQLLKEQVPSQNIFQTGNTVVDAIRWISERPDKLPALPINCPDDYRLVLVTMHRRESFGAPLKRMMQALRTLANDESLKLIFIFPVHSNPNVQQLANEILGDHDHIALTPPLNYATLVAVLAKCWLVLTDSGGLQEEAPSLHKPVLVLRDITERPEGIETGAAELVGTKPANLIASVRRLANEPERYARMVNAVNPYGDGKATVAIITAIQYTEMY